MDEADCMQREVFDLSGAVIQTAALFAPIAAMKEKSFEVDVCEGVSALGDEDAIRRMVSILCDNAVLYASGSGDIRLTMRTSARTSEISVSNLWQKPSDRDALEKIFDRFYRADASRDRNNGEAGFGIGLAIAQKIALRHNGKLYADAPGTGERICFHAIIPIIRDAK
ncbi:MAG: ATP-binding protein [Clostridia bacterium]|nr:ATP-binding protein [Clostridia bacterium]